MLRMDDEGSVSSVVSTSSFIPQKMKFWQQMVPCAGADYMFSKHWPALEGEPDALTATVGDVGHWQVVVVILMMMFNIPTVFHVASPEVSTTDHDFWCHRLNNNLTIEQWRELSSVERYNFRGQLVIDPCYIKDLPYQTAPYEDLLFMASAGDIPCHSWDYNTSKVSVVSQFNLACTLLPVNNVAESVFSLGAAVGGLVTGYLADRVGRKKVLMASQGIVVFVGFLNANVNSYHMYLFARTLLGAACSAVLQTSLLLFRALSTALARFIFAMGPNLAWRHPNSLLTGIEITGGKWRDILSTVYMMSYSMGYIILYLFNKLFISWVYLQYSITLMAIFLLSIWWLVPESPRWLLTDQNLPRLMLMLETASSFNRRALAPGTSVTMKHLPPMLVEHRKPKISMLFKGAAIRRLSIVAPFINFFCSLTYYGLVLNQDLFNYGLFFSGLVEFFAEVVVILLGIRDDVRMVMITNAMSGIACIVAAGLTKSVYLDIACTAARFFGGMMNSCVSTTLASMYPTLIRTLSVGWCFFFSGIALAVAANIVLLSALSAYLPLIILGLSGLLGSFSMLFLPGRVSRDLLDLPEEVEYGHQVVSEMLRENPQNEPEQPKWIPPLKEEVAEPPSVVVEPSSELIKTSKQLINDVTSTQLGVAGFVDPDQYSPKTRAKSPLGHGLFKKKRIRMGENPPDVNAEIPPEKPVRRRRWYFLFIC